MIRKLVIMLALRTKGLALMGFKGSNKKQGPWGVVNPTGLEEFRRLF